MSIYLTYGYLTAANALSVYSLFSYKSVVPMLLGSSVCTSTAWAHIFPKRRSRDKEPTKRLAEETASLSRAIILIFCYHIRNIVTPHSARRYRLRIFITGITWNYHLRKRYLLTTPIQNRYKSRWQISEPIMNTDGLVYSIFVYANEYYFVYFSKHWQNFIAR